MVGARHLLLAIGLALLVLGIGCNSTKSDSARVSEPSKGSDHSQPAMQSARSQLLAVMPPERQTTNDRPADPPQKKLVDEWFKVYHDVLSDLSMIEGHWEANTRPDGTTNRVWVDPRFGTSRLVHLRGHGVPIDAEFIGNQKELRKAFIDQEILTKSWAFGASLREMTKDNMALKLADGRARSRADDKEERKRVLEFAKESLVKLERGEVPFMKMNEWDVQARLMRLNDEACLKCHTENKLNDPVAVFVFATKSKKTD